MFRELLVGMFDDFWWVVWEELKMLVLTVFVIKVVVVRFGRCNIDYDITNWRDVVMVWLSKRALRWWKGLWRKTTFFHFSIKSSKTPPRWRQTNVFVGRGVCLEIIQYQYCYTACYMGNHVLKCEEVTWWWRQDITGFILVASPEATKMACNGVCVGQTLIVKASE